jgi:ABC-type multidrug transport system ATPase subunit
MEIRLTDIGKQFNRDWIFRHLDASIAEGSDTVILGRNGSGKSTLMQIIAGSLVPTVGTVAWSRNGIPVPDDQVYRHLSIVAPYLEVVEEFTLLEMIRFHFSFKNHVPETDEHVIVDRLGLESSVNKSIRNFSSGMRQRVKLILAMLSDVSLILLDEPTMNLDKAGIAWYHDLVRDFKGNRTMIVCSNQQETEAEFASRIIRIEDFKVKDAR